MNFIPQRNKLGFLPWWYKQVDYPKWTFYGLGYKPESSMNRLKFRIPWNLELSYNFMVDRSLIAYVALTTLTPNSALRLITKYYA